MAACARRQHAHARTCSIFCRASIWFDCACRFASATSTCFIVLQIRCWRESFFGPPPPLRALVGEAAASRAAPLLVAPAELLAATAAAAFLRPTAATGRVESSEGSRSFAAPRPGRTPPSALRRRPPSPPAPTPARRPPTVTWCSRRLGSDGMERLSCARPNDDAELRDTPPPVFPHSGSGVAPGSSVGVS